MANIDNGVILGALGSTFINTTAPVAPPDGMIIAAIQFLGDTKPASMIAESASRFINTSDASNNASAGSETVDLGSGGVVVSSSTTQFPAGMTIYGRWTSCTFTAQTNGLVICYFCY